MSETTTTPLSPEDIVQQLRALREQIPEFVLIPRPDAASLTRAANVDADFIQATINAVGASPSLRNALGRSAEELRQDTEFTARWGAVVDELQAMLGGVHAAVTLRRHRIGTTALQTYHMSRQLVRQKDHAYLLPHVEVMKRRNTFGRKRKSAERPVITPSADA